MKPKAKQYPAPVGVKSLCGAANLMAAIFGLQSDELKRQWGLPVDQKPVCPICGSDSSKHFFPYCFAHRDKITMIELECDECEKHFYRQKSIVMACLASRNYKHVFCSSRCVGRRAGKLYGFAAHPENVGLGGGKRKWDWDKVYALHRETGGGARKLGRVLGIPEPTVNYIMGEMGLVWMPLFPRAQNEILELVKANPQITGRTIARRFGVSDSTGYLCKKKALAIISGGER